MVKEEEEVVTLVPRLSLLPQIVALIQTVEVHNLVNLVVKQKIVRHVALKLEKAVTATRLLPKPQI